MSLQLQAEEVDPKRQHRFSQEVLYRGACLYYNESATQAEIANLLGMSRTSVSRLLAEARASGIVHIEVRDPKLRESSNLASQVARKLKLDKVWVAPSTLGTRIGPILAPAVAEALTEAYLRPGDVVLVSSGATMYSLSNEKLTSLPGVAIAPIVGGVDESEDLYQTNEIARNMALNASAIPLLLHAPAMPGKDLRNLLLKEPSIQKVIDTWKTARCALLGIGAPPRLRSTLPDVLQLSTVEVQETIGDIGTRPFNAFGVPIEFAGSEQLFAMKLSDLRRIEHSIGVAVGVSKVDAITVAAQVGYIRKLVTDVETAVALLERKDPTNTERF